MTELWQMSGLALGEAIADREVSAVEALDAIVARVEAVNPKVNAIVTLVAEPAREEARMVDARIADGEKGGPLCGVRPHQQSLGPEPFARWFVWRCRGPGRCWDGSASSG